MSCNPEGTVTTLGRDETLEASTSSGVIRGVSWVKSCPDSSVV